MNTLFSMGQMLALRAFHAAFLCMGGITCTSAWIFWQLSPEPKASRQDVVSLEA